PLLPGGAAQRPARLHLWDEAAEDQARERQGPPGGRVMVQRRQHRFGYDPAMGRQVRKHGEVKRTTQRCVCGLRRWRVADASLNSEHWLYLWHGAWVENGGWCPREAE